MENPSPIPKSARISATQEKAIAASMEAAHAQSASTMVSYTVRTQGYVIPSHKLMTHSQKEIEPQDALEFLNTWLKTGEQSYCAMLGEYGMGKTTTCRLFAQLLLEKHQHHPESPFPIYLDLRNLEDKAHSHEMNLGTIIHSVLHNNTYDTPNKIALDSAEVIRLVQEEGALVIFDGLDEVLVHLSVTGGQQFTRKLLSILPIKDLHARKTTLGRVLLTCRTHFFRTLRDQKAHFTGEDRLGITAENYTLFVLLPFTSAQIFEYLKHAVPHINTTLLLDLIQSVHNLSELAERPYTLSLIPSLIPQIQQWRTDGVRITGVTIYRYIVFSWLKRDSGKHRLTTEHKQQLMEHFAAELWRSGKPNWNITNIENWFIQFLHARPEMAAHYVLGQDENTLYLVLETMKEDLRTATFLVRIGESDFCFAHTSLQEFFLATYLYRALMEHRLEDWNMSVVSKETLDFLGQLLTQGENAPALQTLCRIRECYRPQISELAFAYMLMAHKKGYPTPTIAGIRLEGANLKEWSIEGKPDELLDLQDASFQGANLDRAVMRYLNLDRANFVEAQLSNAEILESQAQAASFVRACFVDSAFGDMNFRKAIFDDAVFGTTQWTRCQLENAQGLDGKSTRCIFVQCEPIDQFSFKYETESLDPLKSGHQSMISDCAFSFDGRQLVSAAWDKTLRIWDVSTGECLSVLKGHEDVVRSGVFSPDGHQVFSGGGGMDRTLRIWDTKTGECLKAFQGHLGSIRKCALSSDGQLVVTAAGDKTLRIWDARTGECLRILEGHEDGLRSCAFSPDGQQLISASDDTTVRIWDTATGECLRILYDHDRPVYGCTFSPDGQQLASASWDKTVRIWNAGTGECLKILNGHENKIRDCAFSPDGKHLTSVSDDYSVRIWNTATGKCLNVLNGHQAKVKCCKFSPCGRYLASGAEDYTLRIWDTITGECVHVLGSSTTSAPGLVEL